MTGQHRWKGKGPKCYHCGRFGYIRRNCRELLRRMNDLNQKEERKTKHKAHNAQMNEETQQFRE